ncbi:hypothetical protein ACW7G0_14005 [Lysobacter sp. A286]
MDTLLRFGCLVLLVLGAAGCWPGERPEVSYANMAEAIKHGAVDRGWIPKWIPASATNIREIHDLDTNESMMAFDMVSSDSWQLPEHCVAITFQEASPPRFSRSWWPSAQELGHSYNFHRCDGDAPFSSSLTWVARHQSGEHSLHWRAFAR